MWLRFASSHRPPNAVHLYITRRCEKTVYDIVSVFVYYSESLQSASRRLLLRPPILRTRAAELATNCLRCSHSQWRYNHRHCAIALSIQYPNIVYSKPCADEQQYTVDRSCPLYIYQSDMKCTIHKEKHYALILKPIVRNVSALPENRHFVV
jgi:hypothetical protein